jgi:hypothetical protein
MTMPALHEATLRPASAMGRTRPDSSSPAPTSIAAVIWGVAVEFTLTHKNGSAKTSRTTR